MIKNFKRILSASLIGLLLLTTGCGSNTKTTANSDESTPKTGGVLNIALHQDPPKLDPSLSSAFVDRHVFQSLFDKLVDIDESGKIIPMLADSWQISEDGKAYTFKLHQGVKFQDGTDFNADAVKFNFDRNMDPASTRRNELGDVSKVTVVDPYTVTIELKNSFAPFLTVLTDRAGMMVSPEAVKKYGKDFANNPVGTGPFVYKERVKGSTITLEKNPNYWQKGLPKLDKVVYKIITDQNVAFMNLKSGQADIIIRFPYNEIANAQSDSKITVINEPGPGFRGMFLNTSTAPFNNPELGQAVDTLIDREAIIKVVLTGAGTAGHSPFPPKNLAYGESDKFEKPDLEKAKELLKQAGKPTGFSFTLKIDQDPISQQVAQMIQNMLRPAGIEMNLEKVEFGTLLDQAKKNDFEAAAVSWSGRLDPDQNIYDWFVVGGSQNYSHYENKEVESLLKAARSELNEAKRKTLYDQALAIIHKDNPYVYFYHEHNVYGISKSVQGFTYIPDGMIRTAKISQNK